MAECEDRGAKEAGKPDYSVPGTYCPITLLNTLGEFLEAVVACRNSYLAMILSRQTMDAFEPNSTG